MPVGRMHSPAPSALAKGHDRARAAQSDVITAIGSEGTPARVQLRDGSGVSYDAPVPIER